MHLISRRGFLRGAGLGLAALSCPAWMRVARAQSVERVENEGDRILALALSRGGHYADLYAETRTRTRILIADSEIRGVEYGIIQGAGVRTVEGEKTGYAFAESFAQEDLESAARVAAGIAVGAAAVAIQPVRELSFPRFVDAAQPLADVQMPARIALLERVERAARAASPLVSQVTIDYHDEDQEFSIANSAGVVAHDRLPVIYLRVTVTAARNGTTAEGNCRLSARRGMELLAGDVPEKTAREAAARALRMLDAVPAPTGEMPVVVAAGGGVMFHEAVGHGLEADAVLREASIFAGRVGQKVAADLVNLYDDATLPGERGSFNVDDEATPAQRTPLIDRGVLVGYLHDRRTARLMQQPTTGNGRRQNHRYPVLVRMTNTCLAPGTDAPEEIIRATARGIYAVNFGGGEVDTASGQFTFGLDEAYLIEDGRVTAPIRGANLVGSGPQVLQSIDRVAGDFGLWPATCGKGDQSAPVTSGCPTLRIASITVGGTA